MKNDDGLEQGSNLGSGKKWSVSGYMLKEKTRTCLCGVWKRKRVKDKSKDFGMSNGRMELPFTKMEKA